MSESEGAGWLATWLDDEGQRDALDPEDPEERRQRDERVLAAVRRRQHVQGLVAC